MKHLILLLSFSLLISTCKNDDAPETGNFEYTISGVASKTISGNETNFGNGNGEFFITLTSGNDDLTLRIYIDPVVPGSYNVNPIFVNGQAQTIVSGDSFADLGIGSSANGDRRNFSTNAANGGSLTISKIETNVVEGSFNMSLFELLGGGVPDQEINIQGEFKAVK